MVFARGIGPGELVVYLPEPHAADREVILGDFRIDRPGVGGIEMELLVLVFRREAESVVLTYLKLVFELAHNQVRRIAVVRERLADLMVIDDRMVDVVIALNG